MCLECAHRRRFRGATLKHCRCPPECRCNHSNNRMIIPDIIEQHWEEAAILWRSRGEAAGSAAFSLTSLAELDERVEAHLDGLRVSGKEGIELCLRAAEWEDPGEAFAATSLSSEHPSLGTSVATHI